MNKKCVSSRKQEEHPFHTSKDLRLWKKLYSSLAPWKWLGEDVVVESNYREDNLGKEPISLHNAHISVLLLSPQYLSSKCYEEEMKQAIERKEANEVELIPVTLYGSPWECPYLRGYTFLPRDKKAVFRNSGDAGIKD